MKSKRNEVVTIHFVQAQVEEMYFIFNLEYRCVALSRGIPHGLPTKSQCSTKSRNPSEMSEAQWSHTLRISLKLENRMVRFPKPDCPILAVMASFQISDILVPNPDAPVFTS
jgi:hypothetical protein